METTDTPVNSDRGGRVNPEHRACTGASVRSGSKRKSSTVANYFQTRISTRGCESERAALRDRLPLLHPSMTAAAIPDSHRGKEDPLRSCDDWTSRSRETLGHIANEVQTFPQIPCRQ